MRILYDASWGKLPVGRQHYAEPVNSDDGYSTRADKVERDLLRIAPDRGCRHHPSCLECPEPKDSKRCPGNRPEGKSSKARW